MHSSRMLLGALFCMACSGTPAPAGHDAGPIGSDARTPSLDERCAPLYVGRFELAQVGTECDPTIAGESLICEGAIVDGGPDVQCDGMPPLMRARLFDLGQGCSLAGSFDHAGGSYTWTAAVLNGSDPATQGFNFTYVWEGSGCAYWYGQPVAASP